jgi:hypothetical protein
LCIHAIGVPEGVTLLEFEGAISEEVQEQLGEPKESVIEGNTFDELPECPDHRPSSLLKGKPPVHADPFVSYINLEYSYLFTTLSCRSCMKTLVALYLSLSRYHT